MVEEEPELVPVLVVSVDDGTLRIDNLALALDDELDRALLAGDVALAEAPSEGLLVGVAPSEVLLVADCADEVLVDGAFAKVVAPSEDAQVAPSEDALEVVVELLVK